MDVLIHFNDFPNIFSENETVVKSSCQCWKNY